VGKSNRKDARGHWPAGKRRNPDGGRWARTRIALAAMLFEHFERGRVSARALAAVLVVDDRTVRRWLDGTDRPTPETQFAIAQWLAEQRKRIKQKKPSA
jgi:hypothetical protein